jgi:hypothetical protein
VSECVPETNAEVANEADPAVNETAPRVVPPSIKVIVPVGVPDAETGATPAVKVTICPKADGLTLETRLALVGAVFTICERLAVAGE